MKNVQNKKEIVVGERFGKVILLNEITKEKENNRYVLVLCDCGNTKRIRLSHLVSGKISSCGCYRIEQVKKACQTHKLTKHPLYNIWSLIKRRCYKKNSKNYKDYGERGIVMCEEWKNNFDSFYNWSIQNNWNKDLQIDRINNDANYCPDNCRWVTAKINSRNRRNNRFLLFNGENKTLAEWAEQYNLKYDTLRNRLDVSKMSIEESLTKPLRKWH